MYVVNTVIKEAEIKICSTIENLDSAGLPMGESERTESCISGYFHVTNDEYFVTYSEEEEGRRTVSEIRYSDGRVTVSRKGAIESVLLFAEGECHTSLYKLPPYTFDAEVKTRRIRAVLSEEGGTVDLHYNMKIGGADKSARMKIWISTNLKRS